MVEVLGFDDDPRRIIGVSLSVGEGCTDFVYRYVAIPRVTATWIDSSDLERRGIGLVVYAENRVEEVLPATPSRRAIRVESDLADRVEQLEERLNRVEEALQGALAKMEELAKEVPREAPPPPPQQAPPQPTPPMDWAIRMERALGEVLESLRKLSSRVDALASAQPPPPPTQRAEEVKAPPSTSDLPSFLRDNPWVEILSKRGRGDER